jgi:hypothetical protein
MSSFNNESEITPNPGQPQNAPFDSGLGSSINPLSGSFGEGYQGSYESEYYDYDQDGGPLSLPLTSLPLLTTVFDNPSQQVFGDGENDDNSVSSTVAHSGETGSASTTVACTTTLAATSTITAHTDENSDLNSLDMHTIAARIAPKDDADLSLSSSQSDGCTTTANTTRAINGDSDRCPSDPNPIHIGTISDSQDENSSDHESDADQDQNDIPSPILSHARAQPLDIIIRGSVVEDHPEIISERTLTDARAYSPP